MPLRLPATSSKVSLESGVKSVSQDNSNENSKNNDLIAKENEKDTLVCVVSRLLIAANANLDFYFL